MSARLTREHQNHFVEPTFVARRLRSIADEIERDQSTLVAYEISLRRSPRPTSIPSGDTGAE